MPSNPKTVHIDTLVFDPANACRHGAKNVAVIEASLRELGAGRSIVLDAEGIVRAGNGTLAAAKKLGMDRVRVIETDGTELIAVKRTDLVGSKATALALADNRASDLHEYDDAALKAAIESIGDLDLDLDEFSLTDADMANMLNASTAKTPKTAAVSASSTTEVDVDAMQLENKCPRCGFEFNDK